MVDFCLDYITTECGQQALMLHFITIWLLTYSVTLEDSSVNFCLDYIAIVYDKSGIKITLPGNMTDF